MGLEELSDLLTKTYRREKGEEDLLKFLEEISGKRREDIIIEAYRVTVVELAKKYENTDLRKLLQTEFRDPKEIREYIGKLPKDLQEEFSIRNVILRYGATIYTEIITGNKDFKKEEYPILVGIIEKLSKDRTKRF